MNKKFDSILPCALWVLAMGLATLFWFNVRYGFNLFSTAHWQYLAYLQAAQIPVRGGFYTSIILCIIIILIGLYMLVRPRLRKIKFDKQRTKKTNLEQIKTDIPAQNAPTPKPTTQQAPIAPARPPRLNMSGAIQMPKQTPQPVAIPVPPIPQPTQDPKIGEIFTNAGYLVKKNAKISGVQTALIAIGLNENMYVGAIGIPTTDMRRLIDRLQQVFSDTLDDIYINVNGFVINAPDAATSEFQDILMFPSVDALGEYIAQNPNGEISAADQDDFNAYSEYIDTVINFIGQKS